MTRALLLLCLVRTVHGAPSLTVCDAIAQRLEYTGSIVAIRAKVSPGGHGPYLEAVLPCRQEIVTRGVSWPNIVALDYPKSSDETAIALDTKAVRRAEDYLRRRAYHPGTDVEIATYVGLLTTYPDLDTRVSPGIPGAIRLGFGPPGLGAPVQLIVQTIRDITVMKGGAAKHDR